MKTYDTDCIKCSAIKTVIIEIFEPTEKGVETLIKPCTSCKQQSTLKEVMDYIQSKTT